MKSAYITLILFMVLAGCRKFVAVDPPNDRLVSATVFNDDASAEAAIVGVYADMMSKDFSYAAGTITWYCGLAADELINHSSDPSQGEFYTNSLTAANASISNLWSQPYADIYAANAILENLERSTGVTDAVKQRLTAEAKFIRAFAHFYLTNQFGKVPLILTTDYTANTNAPNTDTAVIYQQIITDLNDAVILLPDDYSVYGDERVRPTKMAANALLARVYLFTGDMQKAEDLASSVINDTHFDLVPLSDVFLKNSHETIWQLIPLLSNINTAEGRFFFLTGNPSSSVGGVSLRPSLVNSFEPGDMRRQEWIDSIDVDGIRYYFPFKYKVISTGDLSEYYTVLRLSEQYLIRAEARIQQEKMAEGINDLNVIRTRARGPLSGDLPVINANGLTQTDALALVDTERRVELFTEWGHRWFDLKRRGTANAVLSVVKGSSWQNNIDQLFPIPQNQILADPHIIQNGGY